jgi:PIN domain nuclease of toxin-antitoxin system
VAKRLLLDTHTIIWAALDVHKLSGKARSAIEDPDNDIFFSAVTAMEIATKVRIGKLDIARPLATGFAAQMIIRGFAELPLLSLHAEMAGAFLSANNDPWDRLLAAQARLEKLDLITNDSQMADFGISTIW